jgi:hypothetical protein
MQPRLLLYPREYDSGIGVAEVAYHERSTTLPNVQRVKDYKEPFI